jgi:hypothetical protein
VHFKLLGHLDKRINVRWKKQILEIDMIPLISLISNKFLIEHSITVVSVKERYVKEFLIIFYMILTRL